jgi:nicotinamidase-related amidase
MIIPDSKRKKALIIIDVQHAFINDRNKEVVKNISKLLKNYHYDLYVESIFHAEKSSIWDKQIKWTCPKNKFFTDKSIMRSLKGKKIIHIEKSSRSVFKGDKNFLKELVKSKVKELHIVGLQTNSCVLTTALESFDLGFFTYVIEECCESDEEGAHIIGLDVLREQNLTNNSCIEEIDKIDIV